MARGQAQANQVQAFGETQATEVAFGCESGDYLNDLHANLFDFSE